jgi:hypothetical protein
MIEANPVKFYVAKYFFLAFAVIQFLVTVTLLSTFEFSAWNFLIALIFFFLGLAFLFIYFVVNNKIKRVAIGKKKIVVIEGDRNIRFSRPEVKSLKMIIPFFNLYRLKIKGKRNSIYFFPSRNIDPAFGLLPKDSSKVGTIVEKKEKGISY